MQNIRKVFVSILIIMTGIYNCNAKGLQPRIFLPEPSFYEDDSYGCTDTLPAKTFVRIQPVRSAQLKETQQPQPGKIIQVKPEPVTRQVQPANVVLVPASNLKTGCYN